MGWETRIFFDISDDRIKKLLTLESKAVADSVLPNLSPLESYVEKRTDDYVLLSGCPSAEEIGLKARAVKDGAYYTQLELKTVTERSNEAPEESLACWSKTSQYAHGNVADKSALLQFLNGRLQQPLAKTTRDWIKQQQNDALPLVRTEKQRRMAELGSFDVEQTDIVFSMLVSGDSLSLRSWAVEGDSKTDNLQTIAEKWNQRFAKALTATGIKEAPRIWIASYPAIVLQVQELLQKK